MIDLRLGSALELARALPDETVQTIVTSPPYWGLRSYQTQPQIWQNGHALCVEHEWVERRERVDATGFERNRKGLNHAARVSDGNERNAVAKTPAIVRESNTCSMCGAWRGELGAEPTPELYVEHLVQIFRELRRALKDDGTLWLNLGDSFWGGKGQSGANPPEYIERRKARGSNTLEGAQHCIGKKGWTKPGDGKHAVIKPKDLVGIPWMVAFALRADGWHLRSDIIWSKPNPMPESVRDRPTKSHEYIFLLTKSAKYYYDYEAILEPAAYDGRKDTMLKGSGKYANGFAPTGTNPQTMAERGHERWPNKIVGRTERKMQGTGYGGDRKGLHGHSGYFDADGNLRTHVKDGIPARNKRTVWTVTTRPFKGAHFATFPEALIEPCILAGTSAKGECPKCGAAWARVVERTRLKRTELPKDDPRHRPNTYNGAYADINGKGDAGYTETKTLGWEPQCACGLDPVPQIVLDPFSGAGTTMKVAAKHNRNGIGIELNRDYLELSRQRLLDDGGMFIDVRVSYGTTGKDQLDSQSDSPLVVNQSLETV